MHFGEPKTTKTKKTSSMDSKRSQSPQDNDLEAQNNAQVCLDDEVKHSQYTEGQACPELCGGRL